MNNSIGRREFIKRSFAASITAMAGIPDLSSIAGGDTSTSKYDIAVANGTDYFDSTIKAVEALGGIKRFVSRGSRVGILVNSPWNKPGTYTNPDVALAVLKMCLDAGAREIISLESASNSYWKRSKLYKKFENEVGSIKSGDSKINVGIPHGRSLKTADVSKSLIECDVYINVPIVKNHEGTQFTANLKNVMGACSGSTNRFFHKGSGKSSLFGYYDDVEFLSRCIAEVNLVRQPDLCVADAGEFVINNGPAGPGELKKAGKIVAGTKCASVDAYCSTLLDLKPSDVIMIKYANELEMGEIEIEKLRIREI
jgi:uncharacterized protein (DUF362 family)